MRALLFALLLVACKGREELEKTAPTAPVVELRDAAPVADPPSGAWPELVDLPIAQPLRVITIPTRPTAPRFTVGGPVVRGDIAVVASSQFGFAGVDWRRGTLAWTKPAGIKVAPPVVLGDSIALVGDCLSPPEIPDANQLLGCMRVVTPSGSDQAYVAIHGPRAAVEPFLASAGEQQLWVTSERTLRWQRGDAAVSVDVVSGRAAPTETGAPPILVEGKGHRYAIRHVDGKLVATENGKRAWGSSREISGLLGLVRLPEQGPILRMVNIAPFAGASEIRILDTDALGSGMGTAAWTPVPGISLLGRTISAVGDTALAVRLDNSIKRDFIAAYAASALLLYVYPLPQVLRADPVGVAIAHADDGTTSAVLAFYDGDQLAVLPPASAPPTAPGATAGTLENSTP